MKNKAPSHKTLAGFTLIEVLVALFVFSVGLLGLAGLQLKGLQFNQSSYQRSQATLLANDILDRMRANRPMADAGSYNTDFNDTVSNQTCTGTGATCTTTQLAQHDLHEWKQGLADTLPLGKGRIQQITTSTPNNFVITIQWRDDREDPNSAPFQFVLRSAP